MKSRIGFFTVCGGGEDYDFLLGAVEHHAEMGIHLVLDTTPPDKARVFRKLPESVIWIHDPTYGHGWESFRLRSAVEACLTKARLLDVDVLIYLDSDEFYVKDSAEKLFPRALDSIVEVGYVHWRKDGNPYVFGESEWHPRLWPKGSDVRIAPNIAWQEHPKYNGNPEHHPVPVPPENLPVVRVEGHFRHHLHYAIGAKADDDETARNTIAGWPDKGVQVPKVPWPPKLRLWLEKGIRPSEGFL